jgi:hypothetical protein
MSTSPKQHCALLHILDRYMWSSVQYCILFSCKVVECFFLLMYITLQLRAGLCNSQLVLWCTVVTLTLYYQEVLYCYMCTVDVHMSHEL